MKGIAQILLISLSAILLTSQSCKSQDERAEWQPPYQIMDSIGVEPGMHIGEAGAGRGWFTFYLSEQVGRDGIIYANDISRSSLSILEKRARQEKIENIQTVLGSVDDPLFPEKDLDMIVMIYVLHMLEKPMEFLGNLEKYLSPDGYLVILELDTENDRGHYPHFMSRKQIIEAIQESNYTLVRKITFLEKDTIYILKLKT